MIANVEEAIRNVHFINEKQRELFVEAKLGEDVIDFLHTDMGAYLHGVANQEMEIAKQGMADLKPGDPRFKSKYAKLKFDYEVASAFTRWLGEAIQKGKYASFKLENEDY